MRLVAGCPAYGRSWIIDRWATHVCEAARRLPLESLTFVVVGDDVRDPATFDAVAGAVGDHELIIVRSMDEDDSEERNWALSKRYLRMVDLRNLLLQAVRDLDPDRFLSVDSDILLHPAALQMMEDDLRDRGWGAIGSKVYLESPPSLQTPNYAIVTNMQGVHRPDQEGCFIVDVIMALKYMTRSAYHCDYSFHRLGEDFGWSRDARARGVSLGWRGDVPSKHVMSREWLDRVDVRVGF